MVETPGRVAEFAAAGVAVALPAPGLAVVGAVALPVGLAVVGPVALPAGLAVVGPVALPAGLAVVGPALPAAAVVAPARPAAVAGAAAFAGAAAGFAAVAAGAFVPAVACMHSMLAARNIRTRFVSADTLRIGVSLFRDRFAGYCMSVTLPLRKVTLRLLNE